LGVSYFILDFHWHNAEVTFSRDDTIQYNTTDDAWAHSREFYILHA